MEIDNSSLKFRDLRNDLLVEVFEVPILGKALEVFPNTLSVLLGQLLIDPSLHPLYLLVDNFQIFENRVNSFIEPFDIFIDVQI